MSRVSRGLVELMFDCRYPFFKPIVYTPRQASEVKEAGVMEEAKIDLAELPDEIVVFNRVINDVPTCPQPRPRFLPLLFGG